MLATIGKKLAGRGPAEILAVTGKTVWHQAHKLMPAGRRQMAMHRSFDQLWGTDTADEVNMSGLEYPLSLARDCVAYEPSQPDMLDRILHMIDIPVANYSFVDVGSGKGRMVLLAAMAGFREVTGLEYSPRLVEIARQNVAILQSKGGDLLKVAPRFQLGDASQASLASGPLLIYLYNPFGEAVLARFLDNLQSALASEDRPVLIAYAFPVHRELLDQHFQWECVAESGTVAIYGNRRNADFR